MLSALLAVMLLAPQDARKVPDAATGPSWTERGRDTLSVMAWPLAPGARSTPALMLIGGGVLLLGSDVGAFRAIDRGVRMHVRGASIFDYTVHLGDGLFDCAVVGAFALGDERARRTSVEGLEALVSVAATSVLAKHIFRVARPSTNPDAKTYFGKFSHDAFPSGHTMSAFATAAVIATEYPRAAPYAYAASALVGISVMKRRWHWPSDVLVGAGLGILIGRSSVAVNTRHLSFGPEGLSLTGEWGAAK